MKANAPPASDAPSVESEPRHLSPWMLIGGIALLAVVGAVTLAILAAVLAPTPSPVPSGVAQAQLADGSVLVLHGITNSNQLELPDLPESSWKEFFDRIFGAGTPNVTIYGSSAGSNSLTLWLSRYDSQSGRPMEFDRWSHSILTTPSRSEVYDARYASRTTREMPPRTSTSGFSGVRPFLAILPGTYSHIVYSSSLPRVRSVTGEVQIDVFHADDGHIASFTAPLPGGPTTYPTWTPQSLPAIATDGNVEVTLTSLSSQLRYDQHSKSGRPRHEVRYELAVTQDGEPSALWSSQQVRLADALGNDSYPDDCVLSPAEAAWKLHVRMFRSPEAALLQGPDQNGSDGDPGTSGEERLVIEDIPLPDNDPVVLPNSIPHSAAPTVIDGVTISVLGVGGPGKSEYNFKTSHSGQASHSTGDNMRTEFRPPNATLTIDNMRRHIALKVEGDTVDHQVVLLVTDQNGVQIKTDYPRQMNEAHVWLFDADEQSTSITYYITVQRARNVEFTVAPPSPAATE